MKKPTVLLDRLPYGTIATENTDYAVHAIWQSRKVEPSLIPDNLKSIVEVDFDPEIVNYGAKVVELFSILPEREKFVVEQRLLQDCTFAEIAAPMNISPCRVQKLYVTAIRRLKIHLRFGDHSLSRPPNLAPYCYVRPKHPGYAWNEPLNTKRSS